MLKAVCLVGPCGDNALVRLGPGPIMTGPDPKRTLVDANWAWSKNLGSLPNISQLWLHCLLFSRQSKRAGSFYPPALSDSPPITEARSSHFGDGLVGGLHHRETLIKELLDAHPEQLSLWGITCRMTLKRWELNTKYRLPRTVSR